MADAAEMQATESAPEGADGEAIAEAPTPEPTATPEPATIPEPISATSAPPGPSTLSFADMRLKIGTQMRIERLSVTQGGRQVVNLIGYVDKRCLFVTAPADQDHPANTVPYLEGDPVTLRVLSGQNAFGFASRVERVLTSPFHYLHLSFPVQIVAKKVRAAPRVRTQIAARLTGADNQPVDGVLTNLSRAGAELTTTAEVGKPGDAVQLAFTLTLDEGPVELCATATIRSFAKRSRGDDTDHAYGVQFVDLKQGDAIQVSHFINQELAERPELAI